MFTASFVACCIGRAWMLGFWPLNREYGAQELRGRKQSWLSLCFAFALRHHGVGVALGNRPPTRGRFLTPSPSPPPSDFNTYNKNVNW